MIIKIYLNTCFLWINASMEKKWSSWT